MIVRDINHNRMNAPFIIFRGTVACVTYFSCIFKHGEFRSTLLFTMLPNMIQRLTNHHLFDEIIELAPLSVCMRMCALNTMQAIQIQKTRNWADVSLAQCLHEPNLTNYSEIANRCRVSVHANRTRTHCKHWTSLTNLNVDDFCIMLAMFSKIQWVDISRDSMKWMKNTDGAQFVGNMADVFAQHITEYQTPYRSTKTRLAFTLAVSTRVFSIGIGVSHCVSIEQEVLFENNTSVVVTSDTVAVNICVGTESICLMSQKTPVFNLMERNCIVCLILAVPSCSKKCNLAAAKLFLERIAESAATKSAMY